MKCRLRDADMTANANEPDTSFGDEPPRKALAGAEQLGDLADGQVTLNHSATTWPAFRPSPSASARSSITPKRSCSP